MSFQKSIKRPAEGVTYGEMLDRFALLSQVKNLPGDKLCYARSKNLMHLRSFEKMNSAASRIPITPQFETYQKEFSEIRSKFLLKDENGKAMLQPTQTANGMENLPMVDIANPELIAEINSLKEKYHAAIKEREDDAKAYTAFMSDIIPDDEMPKIHLVQISDASGLTQEQVDAVCWFVRETD